MQDLLKGLNIYLIGMMGSGKTTVGKILAKEIGYRFIDSDEMIEKITQKSITELFASAGEAGFRDIESQILREIVPYKNLVVATGGGIVLKTENWGCLRQGIIVWLNVPVAQLYERLKTDQNRPLLQVADPKAQLEKILETRQKLYAQADVEILIDNSQTPEQVSAIILKEIPKKLKPQPPKQAEFN